MADAYGSGPYGETRGGSTPLVSTILESGGSSARRSGIGIGHPVRTDDLQAVPAFREIPLHPGAASAGVSNDIPGRVTDVKDHGGDLRFPGVLHFNVTHLKASQGESGYELAHLFGDKGLVLGTKGIVIDCFIEVRGRL